MARPATPMIPASQECAEGALTLEGGAAFLGICKRQLERIIEAGELEVVYEGRKPRVLKGQLVERLARQLEESRQAGANVRTT